MQTVDSQKTWTIHFNSEIKLDDLSKQAISIHDSNGNLVKTTFNLSNDKKSILIFCPREGYHQGEKYELNLTNKIHSEKGHFLKHPFSFKFKIKEDTPYINDEEIKNLIIDADANLYNVLFDRHLVECLPKSIEGYEYMPLHKFNTYEKLFNHINKCFSRNETDRIINTNYFLNSYNRLSAGCGDPGLNLDVATSKVITTSKTNNKITFDLCGYLDDGSYYPVSNSYTLVLENNHWLIDKNTHWDYSEFPYRDNRNKQLADNSSSFNLNSYFKDPNIEKAIRKQLNKPKEPLSQNDLNTIYYLDLKNKNIRNIDGLENLHNLTYLNLSYNPINNFNSLKNLVNLEYLNLNYTCIHDLKSLDHLTNLSDLYINYSDITDITPLKNLKNLNKP
nr:DL-endopeptidase inhibitor IseA family protein [Clostridium novyi]